MPNTPKSITEQFVLEIVKEMKEISTMTSGELKDLTASVRSLAEKYGNEIKNSERNHQEIIEILKSNSKIIKSVSSSIRNMIITIVVAFTILTGSYFFVKSSIKKIVHDEVHKTKQVLEDNNNIPGP